MENKNIKIQVLGSGCPTCEKLFKLTKQAIEELGLKIDVEYITDIQKIVEMGVMTSPVLAINQKPILAGFLPSLEKIKEIIKKYI
jgi:small redox-active disulfide protein 2